MTLGCHILKAPSGRFTFVGNVPKALCEISTATRADIMGGRAFHGYAGRMLSASPMVFVSEQSARDFADKVGADLSN